MAKNHFAFDGGVFDWLITYSLFRFVPPLDPHRAMNISIGFDNFEILKIDDKDFTVEVNVYLIVIWKDSRIGINFAQVSIFFAESSEKTCCNIFWLCSNPSVLNPM